MMYICLHNSLTESALAKITLHESEYITHDSIPSGVLMLKVIIRESYNDTNATVTFIRERLSSLDTYIKSIDYDIGKFNQYVQDQLQSLHARGQDTQDLLSNLFKGYKATSDREFVQYIRLKENDYNEGNEISPQRLMQLALNRYNTMKEGGSWNAPSEEQTEIIALKAQLKKLQKQRDPKSTRNSSTNQNSRYPEWKSKKPKEGEPKTKKVKGKEYYWCPKHKMWTQHKPDDCKKGQKSESKQTNATSGQAAQEETEAEPTTVKDTKVSRLIQAMATVYSDSDSE